MLEDLHLHHLAPELSRRLEGRVVFAVERGEASRFRFRFAGTRDTLQVSLHSRFPFALAGAEAGLPAPTEWRPAGPLADQLEGLAVEGVDKVDDDRAFRVRLRGPGRRGVLLILLKPVSPALVLLDEDGVTRCVVDPGDKNRFVTGGPFPLPGRPPRPFPAAPALAPILARCEAADLARRLPREFRGLGATLTEECLAVLPGNTADVARAIENRVAAAYQPSDRFHLYRRESRPAGDFRLDPRRDFRLSPVALEGRAGWPCETFPAMAEALAAWLGYTLAHDRFTAARHRLSTRLAGRLATAGKRVFSLESQARSAEDPTGFRKQAEILLVNLHRYGAAWRGNAVRLPDLYDPAGAEIEIPLQPDRGLKENADLLFRRYRKAAIARETLPRLLEKARERLELLEGTAARLGDAWTSEALAAVEAALPGEHPPAAGKGRRDRPTGRKPDFRFFTTTEGHRVLVGKNAADNDRLSFRTARPDDYWFHAADYAGSHVVLEWGRKNDAPQSELLEAAAVAAWFSGARKADRVDVRCTRCKYVRKIKGKAGLVSLAHFATLRVRPELPSAADPE
ncbi:MAG: DUF814 domain-containing protein [Acidobacteria bacterium]|nr:DUF814 domain-containing protein [Acidobacteriota bacterium]